MLYDIIIIGGGPAGLTAGIYSARNGLSTLIIEKESCGGQINYSPVVDNIPGLIHVRGDEFSTSLSNQAEELGCSIEFDTITDIQKCGDNIFYLYGESSSEPYAAKSVIVASGCRHRLLNLPGEKDLIGRGIHFCAACDGAFYKNKSIAVIGGGNSALTEANYLSNLCSQVTILQDLSELTAEKSLVDTFNSSRNTKSICSCKIIDYVIGNNQWIGVTYDRNGESYTEYYDGIFLEIGMEPNTEEFKKLLDLDSRGYIRVSDTGKTNVSGIYAIGDCTTTPVKQVVTACADGAKVIISNLKEFNRNRVNSEVFDKECKYFNIVQCRCEHELANNRECNRASCIILHPKV